MAITIFFTGVTGYIGGPILYKLLQNKGTYHITALVRDKGKAEKLEKLGVRALVGNLDDSKLIAEEAYKADVVLHTADADHLSSAQAIVEGLKKKFQETAKKPIYIHTSGSGNVSVPTRGLSATDQIYDDTDTATLNTIPPTNPHRNVDIFIQDNAAAYNLFLVAPTTIYGRGKTIEGISNPVSVQIPLVIKTALKHKKTYSIGKGLNKWSNVHVEDLASFYVLVLEKALKGELNAPENQGLYFVENGELEWKQIYAEIAQVLHKKGISQDAVVTEANTDEEIIASFGFAEAQYYVGTNSRVKASKGRKIGWAPQYGSADALKSIEADVEFLASQSK